MSRFFPLTGLGIIYCHCLEFSSYLLADFSSFRFSKSISETGLFYHTAKNVYADTVFYVTPYFKLSVQYLSVFVFFLSACSFICCISWHPSLPPLKLSSRATETLYCFLLRLAQNRHSINICWNKRMHVRMNEILKQDKKSCGNSQILPNSLVTANSPYCPISSFSLITKLFGKKVYNSPLPFL